MSSRQIIVVDNFYQNPDDIRAHALKMEFYMSQHHKGHRTQESMDSDFPFEELLGAKLERQGAYGMFTYMTADDPVVYHRDPFDWGCVVYLTPDAPVTAGTSIWRSRHDPANAFAGGFFDRTRFELVDQIGNVFNRAIFWRGTDIHSATEYFGQDKIDSRLTQHFFWNEVK